MNVAHILLDTPPQQGGAGASFSYSAGEEDYQQSAQNHKARKQWQGWDPSLVLSDSGVQLLILHHCCVPSA